MADVVGLYRRFGVRLPELGDGWVSVRCFTGSHKDRHPSCRVHLRTGGFRCFTCGAKGGVLAALELLGVRRDEGRRLAVDYGVMDPATVRRRPRPRPPGIIRAQHAPVPVAKSPVDERVDWDHPAGRRNLRTTLDRHWVYVDRDGRPVGRVRRLDLSDGTKRVWQERPDGDGWTPGLAGATMPLFRLPDVLVRAGRGERILIVEGEKAVDALERIGLFATTNAQGAGKWRDEYTAALEGAVVHVVADCDLKGRLHAIQVSLECLVARIRVVGPTDPDPHRDDGWDIVDHLAGVADTIRGVSPDLDPATIRARLRDHVLGLLNQTTVADGAALQRRLEFAQYTANPAGHAYLECHQCLTMRVHKLVMGYAYCPCGGLRPAP